MTTINKVWIDLLMTEYEWNSPPEHVTLVDKEIHVWRAALNLPLPVIQQLRDLLCEEEQAKAERFYFERDRHQYIVAHGVLRMLLGRYLALDPRLIYFRNNAYGKPALHLSTQAHQMNFNLSHSKELALFAFAHSRSVGVDIEYKRTDIDYEQLAERFFSSQENKTLQELPARLQNEAFYLCWTRKEAYIKARGLGLSLPLELFDVSLTPGAPALLIDSREEPGAAERWSLQELSPGPDYAGALAVEGHHYSVRCWDYSHV